MIFTYFCMLSTPDKCQSEITHFMVNDNYFASSMGNMYGIPLDDLEAGKNS